MLRKLFQRSLLLHMITYLSLKCLKGVGKMEKTDFFFPQKPGFRQSWTEVSGTVIRQSPWSYRREVWCSPAGDEISNPGLNSTIVSSHCLFITWIFISVVSWYVCARNLILGACIIYLFKLRLHLVRLITS